MCSEHKQGLSCHVVYDCEASVIFSSGRRWPCLAKATTCEPSNFSNPVLGVTTRHNSRELVQGWIVFQGTPVPMRHQNVASYSCRALLCDVVWDEVFAVMAVCILEFRRLSGAKRTCLTAGFLLLPVLLQPLDSWIREISGNALKQAGLEGSSTLTAFSAHGDGVASSASVGIDCAPGSVLHEIPLRLQSTGRP